MRQYGEVPPWLAALNTPVATSATGIGGVLGSPNGGGVQVNTPDSSGFGEIWVTIGDDYDNMIPSPRLLNAAAWSKNNIVVADQIAALVNPVDQSQTVSTITDNVTNATHNDQSGAVNVISGVTYVGQGDFRAGTATAVQLTFTGAGFSAPFANFNLATGVVGTTGAVANSGIINLGNGWYRCWFTAVAISTTTTSLDVALTNSNPSATRLVAYAGSGQFIYATNIEMDNTIAPAIVPNNDGPSIGSVTITFPSNPPPLFVSADEQFGPITANLAANVLTVSWTVANFVARRVPYKIIYEWQSSF